MTPGARVILKRYPATGAGQVLRTGVHGVLVRFDDERQPSRWIHKDALMLVENRSPEGRV